MFSPEANFSGPQCPVGRHMREKYAERQAERWPGEGFRLKELLEEFKAPVTRYNLAVLTSFSCFFSEGGQSE